jgi:DNA-binding IclR family transcriptional regulator
MTMKIQATERSFRVLDEVWSQNGARLDDLEQELDIARSTIHRHLQTLVDHGYLVKEGEIYHIDIKFLHLGEYARSRKCGYRLAKNTIHELSDETNQECEFIVESDGRGILVYESYHPESEFPGASGRFNVDSNHVGSYFQLHNHAAGKAILAELPDERVEEIVDRWGLPPKTRNTITTEEELWDELEQIREQGISFADEEFAKGLREVAMCVNNPDGTCLGAIAVIAPTYRIGDEKFTQHLPTQLEKHVSELEDTIEDEFLSDFT